MKRDASYLWNLTISRFASEPKIGSFAEIANLSISKRSIFLGGVTLSEASRPAGPPKSIATPCVMVCAVDGESGLCLGCFRTLGEIAGWRALSDAERAAVMADLPSRRSRVDPAKLG
jgi:predicted Fe-S protein YdhL (DUF1289 family)